MHSNTATIAAIQTLAQSGALKSDASRVTRYIAHPATAQTLALLVPVAAVSLMNQKAILRTVQACDFIATDDTAQCDEVTSALVALIALSNQSRVTFNDAHIVAGAAKEGANVAGVSRARLARFLPRTSNLGTITSKVSRTVGKRGLFTALGITAKGDAHSFELCAGAKSHPFIIGYSARLEQMTEGAFSLLKGNE